MTNGQLERWFELSQQHVKDQLPEEVGKAVDAALSFVQSGFISEMPMTAEEHILELCTLLITEHTEELEKRLIHLGFTNPYQIEYAKEDEGAFYSTIENDCLIPVYMLQLHQHRLRITE